LNRPQRKHPVDKVSFLSILKSRKLSIRQIERERILTYSEKTIRRALNEGLMGIGLVHDIQRYLGISLKEYSREPDRHEYFHHIIPPREWRSVDENQTD